MERISAFTVAAEGTAVCGKTAGIGNAAGKVGQSDAFVGHGQTEKRFCRMVRKTVSEEIEQCIGNFPSKQIINIPFHPV